MIPEVINAKYLITNVVEDGSFLALNILNGHEYFLRRVAASDTLGRKHLEEIWRNSTKAVSNSFISYESAGPILSINGSAVSKEGYFLAEQYISGDKLSETNPDPDKLASIIRKISVEVFALAFQKLTHGNLNSSSILLSENGPMLKGSHPVTFLRGKPDPKKELSLLLKTLYKQNTEIHAKVKKAITNRRSLTEVQVLLSRKAHPSSWLMGIEDIPSDVSYRLAKSLHLGCSIVQVKGNWDHGLDIIAGEVAVLRQISGRITFLLDSKKIEESIQRIVKYFPEVVVPAENPLISFISRYSHLPIEVMLLHRTSDDNSILCDLNKLITINRNNGMNLVVFSENDMENLTPDYVINTIMPPPNTTLIAERTLSAPEKAKWISQLDGITPLEAYQLISGTSELQDADEGLYRVSRLLPGVLKEAAIRASHGINWENCNNVHSPDFHLTTTGRRIWPSCILESPGTLKNPDLSTRLFDVLCKQNEHRYHEVIWLLNYSASEDVPDRIQEAGCAFLRYWKTWGADLSVDRVLPLFEKAGFFLRSVCSTDVLACFILNVIEQFYQSSSVILNLHSTLQPIGDLIRGNPGLQAAVLTLTAWAAYSNGETAAAVDLALDAIRMTEGHSRSQHMLFRIFVYTTALDLESKQEIVFNAIQAHEEKAVQQGNSAESAFFNVISAAVLKYCGDVDGAHEILQRIPAPDSRLHSWTSYEYYMTRAQLAARNDRLTDCVALQGKAHQVSTFSNNRILAHTSILSYDITLEFQGHYTRRNVLERMDWLKSVFRYYGARRLIAHVDCNLMITHLSLLNRNASLRHAESVLTSSADLIKGNLSPYVFSFASFAFLTGQPERAVSDLRLLKKRGGTLIEGSLEGIEHFLKTNSTAMMDSTELIVSAETLKWLGTSPAIDEWVSALGGIGSLDSSDVLYRFRKGNLLQGYVHLLIGLAKGDIGTTFLERNRWLLQAVDTRFSRSGFLRLPSRKTPLEQMIDYVRDSGRIIEDHSGGSSSQDGNCISDSRQMCRKLTNELEVERVWIIRKKNNNIDVLSSSEEELVFLLPSWVTEALDWLTDSCTDKIDLPSEGWVRGYPCPGVFVIEICSPSSLQAKQQLYIAVESLKPGRVLSKVKTEMLILISGLLAQSALYERRVSEVRGLLISDD